MKPIAAQLYTLREYIQNFQDIETTFRKLKTMGYNEVQFSGAKITDAKELKRIADATGIHIICTHIPYEDMQNDLKKVIEDHQTLGCLCAGVGSMPSEYRSAEGFHTFAKEFDQIAEELKKEGLGATYHNHRFEFEKFDGKKTGMDILLEDSNTFTFMADTYWIQSGGGDVVDWIYKLRGRIQMIHFKDMMIQDNEQHYAEVMEGNLNWKGILDACENTGIEYYIIEQDICQRDPFESLEISLRNLKNV